MTDYGEEQRRAKAFNRALLHADSPRPRWRLWALWLVCVVGLALILWARGL